MKKDVTSLMRLLQFTDSAFPVGGFSFSNGLETAAQEGAVCDAPTLEAYTRVVAIQAAHTDGISALSAFRAARRGDYAGVLTADGTLMRSKMNAESRLMLTRMGRKFAELASHFIPSPFLKRWLQDIKAGISPGTYPVAQALVFDAVGLAENELFVSHQYGVVNMVLNAALRCVKVSHYDTQTILFKLASCLPEWYEEVATLRLEDMNAFSPEMDIWASLHEKGKMRMFMN